jgi:hypothetical protein
MPKLILNLTQAFRAAHPNVEVMRQVLEEEKTIRAGLKLKAGANGTIENVRAKVRKTQSKQSETNRIQ